MRESKIARSGAPGGLRDSASAHTRAEHRDARHAAATEVAHRREHVLEQRVGVRARRGSPVAANIEWLAPGADGPRATSQAAHLAWSKTPCGRTTARGPHAECTGQRPPCPHPPSRTIL